MNGVKLTVNNIRGETSQVPMTSLTNKQNEEVNKPYAFWFLDGLSSFWGCVVIMGHIELHPVSNMKQNRNHCPPIKQYGMNQWGQNKGHRRVTCMIQQ